MFDLEFAALPISLVEIWSFATGHKQLLPYKNYFFWQKLVVLDKLLWILSMNNSFLQKGSCCGQVILDAQE